MNAFTENFRRLRQQNYKSMTQFASDFGVHIKQVSRWETGETSISLEKAIELAHFFKVSLDELCGLTTENHGVPIGHLTKEQQRAVRVIVDGLG